MRYQSTTMLIIGDSVAVDIGWGARIDRCEECEFNGGCGRSEEKCVRVRESEKKM